MKKKFVAMEMKVFIMDEDIVTASIPLLNTFYDEKNGDYIMGDIFHES